MVVDTGTGISMVSEEFFDMYLREGDGVKLSSEGETTLLTANGGTMKELGRVKLPLVIGKMETTHIFRVIIGLRRRVILGNDLLSKMHLIIDPHCEQLALSGDEVVPIRVRVPQESVQPVRLTKDVKIPANSITRASVRLTGNEGAMGTFIIETTRPIYWQTGVYVRTGATWNPSQFSLVELVNPSPVERLLHRGATIAQLECAQDIPELLHVEAVGDSTDGLNEIRKQIDQLDLSKDTDLTLEQQQIVREFLRVNADIFAKNPKSPGTNLKVRHHIDTGNHPSIKQRPFRISPKEQEIIHKEVGEMLQNGIIRSSRSPWASPVVLVMKKDGSIRFCVDYRKLNQITKKDVYPLPRIDDMLDTMANMHYYTSIDLASGYWQVELEESSKEKTAFTSCAGLFEFNVMPFGLCNAPATFQRMMDEVIAGLDLTEDYLDDVITGTKTFEEHLASLKKLFDRLRQYNLAVKLSKCEFFRNRLIYLGHEIAAQGVSPDKRKIEVIRRMSPPTDISGLRRFLGMTSYYRRFIEGYARKAEPLTRLLRKSCLYKWNDDCQKAFETLKRSLTEAPILRYPDFTKPFRLYTDASTKGLGAILAQEDDEHQEYVVAYASRTLNSQERKYSITELECLAIVWSVNYYRPYLYGRKFEVITDHSALRWLMELKSPSGRLARWSLKLQEYDMEIKHRPGRKHSNVDPLSRLEESATIVNVIEPIEEREYIMREQQLDPNLRKLINYLEHGTLPTESKESEELVKEAEVYVLHENVLYRDYPTTHMKRRGVYILRLVVPASLQSQILFQNHNELIAGHPGIKRTYERIAMRYYWTGMYKTVQEWVNMCVDCSMRKGSPNQKYGVSYSIPTSEPFEILGTDVLGPFPRTYSGHRYILVFTDHFTKWVEAFALERVDAATVAQCFVEEIVCRHGAPKRILTDQGSVFVNQFLREVERLLRVTPLRTSSYHPQTNGITERFNRTLTEMLSMYVSSHQKDWDLCLPYVLFAYRTTPHASTKETPFFLIHGRDPNLPGDLLKVVDKSGETSQTTDQYKNELIQRLIQVYQESQYYANVIKQRRERKANELRKNIMYQVGDLVWLYTRHRKKGLSPKLMHPWHGPYRIVEYTSPMNVRLRTLTNKVLELPVHVSRLKKYTSPQVPRNSILNDQEAFQETESTEKDEEWEVESIVDLKRHGNQWLYRVHWKGYSDQEDTWEPNQNLAHCQQAIEHFHRKEGLICSHCGHLSYTGNGVRGHMRKYHSQ